MSNMGRACRPAGVTLVELVVALAVLAIAVLALLSAIYQSNLLGQATRERTVAYNAARQQIELIRGLPVHEVYGRYNADPGDDPGGKGAAPGPEFDVPGLAARPGARVGRISFPEAGVPPSLREDVCDASFGMPRGRDLNRDGRIDALPRAGDYRILPMRITLTWEGVSGRQRLEMGMLLTEK